MTKLYTLFLIIAMSISANAFDGRMNDNKNIQPASQEFINSLSMELGREVVSAPISKYSIDYLLAGSTDTLTKYLDRSTFFRIYGITIQGQQFPLVGTNSIYYFAGQKFDLEAQQINKYKLTGILIPLAINVFVGANNDTNRIWVYPTDGSGNPSGNPIATGMLYLAESDSSSVKPLYNFASVERTEEVLAPNFIVFVQTLNFDMAESDFVCIWANDQGDGMLESRSAILAWDSNNSTWVVANFANLQINMADGNPPDFDVLILPVIESLDGTDVEEPISINGLTFEGLYPNPVKTNGTVKFSCQENTELSIQLLDMNGRLVLDIHNGNVAAGQHVVDFDAAAVSSGTYMLAFRSGNNGFAVKTAIVR